jgi:hypothetical protein
LEAARNSLSGRLLQQIEQQKKHFGILLDGQPIVSKVKKPTEYPQQMFSVRERVILKVTRRSVQSDPSRYMAFEGKLFNRSPPGKTSLISN